MKKITSCLILTLGALLLSSCRLINLVNNNGSTSQGGNSNNTSENNSEGESGGNESHGGGQHGNKTPHFFIGDENTLPRSAQARVSWKAESYFATYEFDTDGKCLKSYTTYTLGNPADYEVSNQNMISGNWEPEWIDSNSRFRIYDKSISYTDIDDAYDYFDSHFFGYNIEFYDGTSERAEPLTQEQKNAKFTESFGAAIGDIISYAVFTDITINYHYLRDFSMFGTLETYTEENAINAVNGYAQYLFDIYKLYSDDGTIRDYISNDQILTQAEVVDNIYDSSYFSFFRDQKEVVVRVGVDINHNEIEYYMQKSKN